MTAEVVKSASARVLITGAGGLLGSALVPYLGARGYRVTAAPGRTGPREPVDLTRMQDVGRLLDAAGPDVIINLAALTNVDHCEQHPAEAYRANAGLVLNLVRWIGSAHSAVRLVQVSTDQLYDGEGPHEEDSVCPTNVYAYTKCLAEEYALRVGGTSLRTNFFGRSGRTGRHSFSDWIVRSLRAGQRITVFGDVQFSPLSLRTLVRSIELVLRKPAAGAFNLGSRSGMSKADFAFQLAAALRLDTSGLVRGSVADVTLTARRPRDMRMQPGRFEACFDTRAPELTAEIEKAAGEYADETL